MLSVDISEQLGLSYEHMGIQNNCKILGADAP
jgi:hypothetical protein